MIDLNLDREPASCNHCEAQAEGLVVLTLSESKRDLLHQMLEQVLHAGPEVRMSGAERADLRELHDAVRPVTRHAGRTT
jgi:hypothetical protein